MGKIVFDRAALLAIPVALLAGFVSFASPCVAPPVRGYLSCVTGLSGSDLTGGQHGRVWIHGSEVII